MVPPGGGGIHLRRDSIMHGQVCGCPCTLG